MRRRKSRRRTAVARAPIPKTDGPNSRWSTDFVQDQLANGRRFRVLTIIDDVTKECLAAIPDTSPSGKRAVREMRALIARRGKPGMIVSDNGAEFTSSAVLGLHPRDEARLALHRTGQADPRHACAESFQGRMRDEGLNEHLFFSMSHARAVIAGWVDDFNTARPPFGDRRHDARRLCRDPETAAGAGAAPVRKLRADARCCRRALAQFSARDSSSPRRKSKGSRHDLRFEILRQACLELDTSRSSQRSRSRIPSFSRHLVFR